MAHKFRASIYIDIFIEEQCKYCGEVPYWWNDFKCTNPAGHELAGLENLRKKAQDEVEEIGNNIPNSYIGGVATMDEILSDKVKI